MFGRQSSLFLAAREVSCHHTLRWTPFFKCTSASSRRCAANNLFIYSSHPRYSRLVTASWSWNCNSARNEKVGSSCYKMWAGLNGFDPRTNFVLGGVRIGMGCMNLVTVISGYTWLPVTLSRVHAHTCRFCYLLMRSDCEFSLCGILQLAILPWTVAEVVNTIRS